MRHQVKGSKYLVYLVNDNFLYNVCQQIIILFP